MVKIKRASIVICLAALFVVLMSCFSFGAEDFSISRTAPVDGAKNTTKDNMCVKVFFNNDVGNAASRKENADKFSITDSEGKEYPTLIYYNDKDSKYVLIAVDSTKITSKEDMLKDNEEYTMTISKDFIDNDGNKLGDDPNRIVKFTTINQKRNTAIYMILMVGMMIGMVVFSLRQSRKSMQAEAEAAGDAYIDTFNPYKEARRTGKSLEEVIAIHDKEVAKREAKEAKKAKKNAASEEDLRRDGEYYRVKRPRPISETGSTFKTGRKALAEAEAARKEAEKAERKANNYAKVKKPANVTQTKGKKKR